MPTAYAKSAILTHNCSMNRILIIGCGDIAMRVAPLLQARYRLFGLARRTEHFAELRAAGIIPLRGNLDNPASLARIVGLADVVLHFAPPSSTDKSPLRPPFSKWGTLGARGMLRSPNLTRGARRGFEFADHRTRNLLAALSRGASPKRLIYISTSGVYGDCGGAPVNETHPLNPQTARAQRRIDAEQQIRRWAKRNGVQASILRVPGIYAANRLPLDRLRTGTPAIAQAEDSYTNHIHADDLARIVVAALRNGKPNRVYHAADDSEMKMGEYFDVVADAYGLPRPPRLPRAEVEHSVSTGLWSFMNESRRLTNGRMKKELKLRLRYPTMRDGLALK